MKLYANLHTHSTHSDGVYTPEEIVKIAKDEGYKAFALADHDTVSGYEEMKAACQKEGLEYLFAAEFTTYSPALKAGFHIVGYEFDPEYPPMKKYLEEMSYTETIQTKKLFERGLRLGLLKDITWEEVLEYNKGITWLCNEHVFRALKAKGLMQDTDYPKFFEELYGDHRYEDPPAYPFLSPEELIPLVQAAGGIAVFAHPGKHFQYINDLLKMGIDGIEMWYSSANDELHKKTLDVALKHNLYVTGGSDHEGLCGGQYARYERPEETPWYAPPCTLGTTEAFFREVKQRRLNPERKKFIEELLKIY